MARLEGIDNLDFSTTVSGLEVSGFLKADFIQVSNDGAITFKDSSGNLNVNLATIDSSDRMVIGGNNNASTIFRAGANTHLQLTTGGDLYPLGSGQTLGRFDAQFDFVQATEIRNDDGASELIVNQRKLNNIAFYTNNSRKWYMTSGGQFYPDANSVYNIGANSLRVNVVYTDGVLPFTGSHLFIPEDGQTFVAGDAVCLSDDLKLEVCSSASGSDCVGIYCGLETTVSGATTDSTGQAVTSGSTLLAVAAVGDSNSQGITGFSVCNQNGPISKGDLLCTSDVPGHLMKQDGSTLMSYTVGKSLQNEDFSSSSTASGVYGFIYCG